MVLTLKVPHVKTLEEREPKLARILAQARRESNGHADHQTYNHYRAQIANLGLAAAEYEVAVAALVKILHY